MAGSLRGVTHNHKNISRKKSPVHAPSVEPLLSLLLPCPLLPLCTGVSLFVHHCAPIVTVVIVARR